MYTFAGVNNPATGWGRAHETWNFMSALGALGGDAWFRLGDRDLAVHVLRTLALQRGATLSEITHTLAKRFGIRHNIVPMSDSPVRTRVLTSRRELAFQDYFVRRRCGPRVTGFRYSGSRKAGIAPALQKIMRTQKVRAVVICPSNPYLSVAPILSVSGIRAWMKQRNFPVVAVSPIVGGAALKGPAAKMMRELDCEVTALGIVRHYGDCVDGWVIDRHDAKLQCAIEREGKTVIVADTVMSNRRKSAQLAQRVVAFARALASERR
jgi:LPPG:FO 2-phospho-L-lactate transferase